MIAKWVSHLLIIISTVAMIILQVHLSFPFEHSSAYLCGLREGDRFKASITATKNSKDLSVHSNKDSKIIQHIKTASEKGYGIIIAVQRK